VYIKIQAIIKLSIKHGLCFRKAEIQKRIKTFTWGQTRKPSPKTWNKYI